jgi:hypothetical protein
MQKTYRIKSDEIMDMKEHQARIWYEMAMDYFKDLSQKPQIIPSQDNQQ